VGWFRFRGLGFAGFSVDFVARLYSVPRVGFGVVMALYLSCFVVVLMWFVYCICLLWIWVRSCGLGVVGLGGVCDLGGVCVVWV